MIRKGIKKPHTESQKVIKRMFAGFDPTQKPQTAGGTVCPFCPGSHRLGEMCPESDLGKSQAESSLMTKNTNEKFLNIIKKGRTKGHVSMAARKAAKKAAMGGKPTPTVTPAASSAPTTTTTPPKPAASKPATPAAPTPPKPAASSQPTFGDANKKSLLGAVKGAAGKVAGGLTGALVRTGSSLGLGNPPTKPQNPSVTAAYSRPAPEAPGQPKAKTKLEAFSEGIKKLGQPKSINLAQEGLKAKDIQQRLEQAKVPGFTAQRTYASENVGGRFAGAKPFGIEVSGSPTGITPTEIKKPQRMATPGGVRMVTPGDVQDTDGKRTTSGKIGVRPTGSTMAGAHPLGEAYGTPADSGGDKAAAGLANVLSQKRYADERAAKREPLSAEARAAFELDDSSKEYLSPTAAGSGGQYTADELKNLNKEFEERQSKREEALAGPAEAFRQRKQELADEGEKAAKDPSRISSDLYFGKDGITSKDVRSVAKKGPWYEGLLERKPLIPREKEKGKTQSVSAPAAEGQGPSVTQGQVSGAGISPGEGGGGGGGGPSSTPGATGGTSRRPKVDRKWSKESIASEYGRPTIFNPAAAQAQGQAIGSGLFTTGGTYSPMASLASKLVTDLPGTVKWGKRRFYDPAKHLLLNPEGKEAGKELQRQLSESQEESRAAERAAPDLEDASKLTQPLADAAQKQREAVTGAANAPAKSDNQGGPTAPPAAAAPAGPAPSAAPTAPTTIQSGGGAAPAPAAAAPAAPAAPAPAAPVGKDKGKGKTSAAAPGSQLSLPLGDDQQAPEQAPEQGPGGGPALTLDPGATVENAKEEAEKMNEAGASGEAAPAAAAAPASAAAAPASAAAAATSAPASNILRNVDLSNPRAAIGYLAQNASKLFPGKVGDTRRQFRDILTKNGPEAALKFYNDWAQKNAVGGTASASPAAPATAPAAPATAPASAAAAPAAPAESQPASPTVLTPEEASTTLAEAGERAEQINEQGEQEPKTAQEFRDAMQGMLTPEDIEKQIAKRFPGEEKVAAPAAPVEQAPVTRRKRGGRAAKPAAVVTKPEPTPESAEQVTEAPTGKRQDFGDYASIDSPFWPVSPSPTKPAGRLEKIGKSLSRNKLKKLAVKMSTTPLGCPPNILRDPSMVIAEHLKPALPYFGMPHDKESAAHPMPIVIMLTKNKGKLLKKLKKSDAENPTVKKPLMEAPAPAPAPAPSNPPLTLAATKPAAAPEQRSTEPPVVQRKVGSRPMAPVASASPITPTPTAAPAVPTSPTSSPPAGTSETRVGAGVIRRRPEKSVTPSTPSSPAASVTATPSKAPLSKPAVTPAPSSTSTPAPSSTPGAATAVVPGSSASSESDAPKHSKLLQTALKMGVASTLAAIPAENFKTLSDDEISKFTPDFQKIMREKKALLSRSSAPGVATTEAKPVVKPDSPVKPKGAAEVNKKTQRKVEEKVTPEQERQIISSFDWSSPDGEKWVKNLSESLKGSQRFKEEARTAHRLLVDAVKTGLTGEKIQKIKDYMNNNNLKSKWVSPVQKVAEVEKKNELDKFDWNSTEGKTWIRNQFATLNNLQESLEDFARTIGEGGQLRGRLSMSELVKILNNASIAAKTVEGIKGKFREAYNSGKLGTFAADLKEMLSTEEVKRALRDKESLEPPKNKKEEEESGYEEIPAFSNVDPYVLDPTEVIKQVGTRLKEESEKSARVKRRIASGEEPTSETDESAEGKLGKPTKEQIARFDAHISKNYNEYKRMIERAAKPVLYKYRMTRQPGDLQTLLDDVFQKTYVALRNNSNNPDVFANDPARENPFDFVNNTARFAARQLAHENERENKRKEKVTEEKLLGSFESEDTPSEESTLSPGERALPQYSFEDEKKKTSESNEDESASVGESGSSWKPPSSSGFAKPSLYNPPSKEEIDPGKVIYTTRKSVNILRNLLKSLNVESRAYTFNPRLILSV